jgi:hypothetical protein
MRAGHGFFEPSPVMVLMPLFLGEAATTSWPPWRKMAAVFEPDQAGAADDAGPHGLASLVDDRRPFNGFECASSDAQIRTDRTMPRPNRAFLFSALAAAVIDVLVTDRLGHRARHGRTDPSRILVGIRRLLPAAEVSFRSGWVVVFRRRQFR